MSKSRNDPHKARLRRERIRRGKRQDDLPPPASPAPPPFDPPQFAMERSLRRLEVLMQGREQDSVEDLGAWLKELNSRARVSEIAEAWMQDDPKWRAQELAYDALEANGLEEALYLAGEAQKLDPECTDAQGLTVALLPTSAENRVHLMREVVATAERNLGESFEQDAGHFWLKVSTRPYMRAAQHLGELLAGAGQFDEAAAIFDRMLDLNPNDNQGMRYPLLCMYLATGNPEAAASVLSRFPGEEGSSALFAWGRTMERFLSGGSCKILECGHPF